MKPFNDSYWLGRRLLLDEHDGEMPRREKQTEPGLTLSLRELHARLIAGRPIPAGQLRDPIYGSDVNVYMSKDDAVITLREAEKAFKATLEEKELREKELREAEKLANTEKIAKLEQQIAQFQKDMGSARSDPE